MRVHLWCSNVTWKPEVSAYEFAGSNLELYKTTWVIGQLKKWCERKSVEKEQREQLVSKMGEGIDWEIIDLVGMMFS